MGEEENKDNAPDGEGEKKEEEQSSSEIIANAREAAEVMKEAAKLMKIENDRKDKDAVERALGGKSKAGQAPVIPQEETPEEYAKKVMAGDLNV